MTPSISSYQDRKKETWHTSDTPLTWHTSEQLTNITNAKLYANYHIQNVLNLVMIFITAWEHIRLIRDIFHICSVQVSCATTPRSHFRAWVVLKLPCIGGHEVICLFIAFFLLLSTLLQHLIVLVWTIIGQNNTACRLFTSFPPVMFLYYITTDVGRFIYTGCWTVLHNNRGWSWSKWPELNRALGFYSDNPVHTTACNQTWFQHWRKKSVGQQQKQ